MHTHELAGRDVHIWSVRLQAVDGVVANFHSLLAPDEAARAARFRFDHLRRNFILSRGSLRVVLGHYLDTPANRIRFICGTKGKPRLAMPARMHFNASHSGAVALFAFTLHGEVGVDVERIRPLSDLQAIASRYFCAEESAELVSLSASEREHAFFLCWTRKEAYLKAVGDGLSAPLDSFRTVLRPGEPAALIHIAGDRTAAKSWTMHDLSVAPDYAAALAYRDAPRPIQVMPPVEPEELLDSMRK